MVSPAHGWTWGDTLTTIWRPLPNLPAIARPGDTVTVWANAAAGAGSWGASLHFGALTVPLAAAGGGYQATKGRWELGFRVPPGTPEELYDLELTSNATALDVASHAVMVIPRLPQRLLLRPDQRHALTRTRLLERRGHRHGGHHGDGGLRYGGRGPQYHPSRVHPPQR